MIEGSHEESREEQHQKTKCDLRRNEPLHQSAPRVRIFAAFEHAGWFYGGWAHDMNGVRPKGFMSDGNPPPAPEALYTGPCVMNCSNEYSIYSFHTGGSNMLFADGSVRFLNERITWAEFAPFGTRNRGDIPSANY